MKTTTNSESGRNAIQRFLSKEKEFLTIPDSILAEYRQNEKDRSVFGVNPGAAADEADAGPPIAQYTDAHGYVFAWGHILERRVNQFVIWDFCPTDLLTYYVNRGLRLRDLQRIVFEQIEAEVECASREPAMAVGLVGGWAVYPGGAVSVITLVVHFVCEDEGRNWTAETLIENLLPKVMAKARKYADNQELW